jgi:hypothetical protein
MLRIDEWDGSMAEILSDTANAVTKCVVNLIAVKFSPGPNSWVLGLYNVDEMVNINITVFLASEFSGIVISCRP